jgi:hypothetical protein
VATLLCHQRHQDSVKEAESLPDASLDFDLHEIAVSTKEAVRSVDEAR